MKSLALVDAFYIGTHIDQGTRTQHSTVPRSYARYTRYAVRFVNESPLALRTKRRKGATVQRDSPVDC